MDAAKTTILKLQAGDRVRIDGDLQRFCGFECGRLGDSPRVRHSSWAEVRRSLGVRTLRMLDRDAALGIGPSIRAVFTELNEDGTVFAQAVGSEEYTWSAYRFQGRWVLGSSADRFELRREV